VEILSAERSTTFDAVHDIETYWEEPSVWPFPGQPPDCVAIAGVHPVTLSESGAGTDPFTSELCEGVGSMCSLWPSYPNSPSIGCHVEQTSTLSPSQIRAVGSHDLAVVYWGDAANMSDGAYSVFVKEYATAESTFSVQFELDEATPYSLSGFVDGWTDSFDPWDVHVTLTGPGGAVQESFVVPPGCSPHFPCPVPFDVSGVLAPGVYTLEARSSGGGEGTDTSWERQPEYSQGEFDVTLSLRHPSVPGLGWAGRVLLVSSLLLGHRFAGLWSQLPRTLSTSR
jgi:hypothetical protein